MHVLCSRKLATVDTHMSSTPAAVAKQHATMAMIASHFRFEKRHSFRIHSIINNNSSIQFKRKLLPLTKPYTIERSRTPRGALKMDEEAAPATLTGSLISESPKSLEESKSVLAPAHGDDNYVAIVAPMSPSSRRRYETDRMIDCNLEMAEVMRRIDILATPGFIEQLITSEKAAAMENAIATAAALEDTTTAKATSPKAPPTSDREDMKAEAPTTAIATSATAPPTSNREHKYPASKAVVTTTAFGPVIVPPPILKGNTPALATYQHAVEKLRGKILPPGWTMRWDKVKLKIKFMNLATRRFTYSFPASPLPEAEDTTPAAIDSSPAVETAAVAVAASVLHASKTVADVKKDEPSAGRERAKRSSRWGDRLDSGKKLAISIKSKEEAAMAASTSSTDTRHSRWDVSPEEGDAATKKDKPPTAASTSRKATPPSKGEVSPKKAAATKKDKRGTTTATSATAPPPTKREVPPSKKAAAAKKDKRSTTTASTSATAPPPSNREVSLKKAAAAKKDKQGTAPPPSNREVSHTKNAAATKRDIKQPTAAKAQPPLNRKVSPNNADATKKDDKQPRTRANSANDSLNKAAASEKKNQPTTSATSANAPPTLQRQKAAATEAERQLRMKLLARKKALEEQKIALLARKKEANHESPSKTPPKVRGMAHAADDHDDASDDDFQPQGNDDDNDDDFQPQGNDDDDDDDDNSDGTTADDGRKNDAKTSGDGADDDEATDTDDDMDDANAVGKTVSKTVKRKTNTPSGSTKQMKDAIVRSQAVIATGKVKIVQNMTVYDNATQNATLPQSLTVLMNFDQIVTRPDKVKEGCRKRDLPKVTILVPDGLLAKRFGKDLESLGKAMQEDHGASKKKKGPTKKEVKKRGFEYDYVESCEDYLLSIYGHHGPLPPAPKKTKKSTKPVAKKRKR